MGLVFEAEDGNSKAVRQKRPWRYFLIYLFTFPADIIVWFVVLFIWLLWGTKLEWNEGLWCELKKNSWPARSWYRLKIKGEYVKLPEKYYSVHGEWLTWGGTCFGHGGFYGPGKAGERGIDTRTEYHEHIHVEQTEVALLLSFLQAMVVFGALFYLRQPKLALWIGGGVWIVGFLFKAMSGGIVAWLRGEDPYRGSTHEEAAYALDQSFPDVLAAEHYEKTKHGL